MPRRTPKALACLVAAAAVAVGLVSTAAAPGQAAATVCSTMTTPVSHVSNPSNQAALLTRWPAEAAKAARSGFSENRGTPFRAAVATGSGLVPVHRMYQSSGRDFVWMHLKSQIDNAVTRHGYVDEGVAFYASAVAAPCAVKVDRFLKSGMHRFAVSTAERAELTAGGWRSEGAGFYAAAPKPSSVDTKFSIAVMPDTQQEVLKASDRRFVERSQWLVDHRSSLDLRFVSHVGDVVNWDTPDHAQTVIAQAALRPLETAKIPYSLSIGNHDTQATGVGGSARDPARTRALVRDTSTFNAYFSAARYGAVKGAFETGKVDNIYSTFEAGGDRWLVMNLELWPRTAVVAWAKSVVSSHPDHNVVLVTHSYLNSNGSISASKDYGDNSGQYLFDNLVKVYPNVKLVFSGHVGRSASRVDTGVHGNMILSYLQAFHSGATNPVRLAEIDTANGTVSTRVYGPRGDQTLTPASTQTRMSWALPKL